MNRRAALSVLVLFSLLISFAEIGVKTSNAPAVQKKSTIYESIDHAILHSNAHKAASRTFEGDSSSELLDGSSTTPHPAQYVTGFTRHLICKDHTPYYEPVNPTTIFRPNDTKAVCLTTVNVSEGIEFRWQYRSNVSTSWISCYNWSDTILRAGEHYFAGYFKIAGHWPSLYYPMAYRVEVFLDGDLSFSEYFEVTNGGLNSPRMCDGVEMDGYPVDPKSRFTIGVDSVAYHQLRFDNIAYFNEDLANCHNFTTVWVQPNGSTYKSYSGSFLDYKDGNVSRSFWKAGYVSDNYIEINSSTPIGNWRVELYLDRYLNYSWASYDAEAVTPFVVGNESVADWTFMVYLDADNGLETPGVDIFTRMASVGATSDVNIVVQMDRIPGEDHRYGNWTGCKRFNVTKGVTPTPENETQDLLEVNMGHPDTLRDFVNWTIDNFPSTYYSLVLWDHGIGCMGFCFDETDEDWLSLAEARQALMELPVIIDVLVADACSMAMLEVAYQFRDHANILVGPEGLGYAPAPYHYYVSSLTDNSTTRPVDFARRVVEDYMYWCHEVETISNATMSAVDLTRITSLIAPVDDLSVKLMEAETPHFSVLSESHKQIIQARGQVEKFPGPYASQNDSYVDLSHLAQLIRQYVDDPLIQSTAGQVIDALESVVIIDANKARPDSHGLAMFFPTEKATYDLFEDIYGQSSFASDISWDGFLRYHLSGHVITIHVSQSDVVVEINAQAFFADETGDVNVFLLPDSYTVNATTIILLSSDSRKVFLQWGDNVTSTVRTVSVNSSIQLEAEYATEFRLVMTRSSFGTTDPPEGEYWHRDGTDLNLTATAPDPVSGERYIWTRWLITGQGGDNLTDNPGSVTVNAPLNVTANWRHEYLLTIDTEPSGLGKQPNVSRPGPWYVDSTEVNCTAQEIEGYGFSYWTIDGTVSSEQGRSILVVMDGPHELLGHYVEILPWWQSFFGSEIVQISLGLAGTIAAVAMVRVAWTRNRRRRMPRLEPLRPTELEPTEPLPNRVPTGFVDLDNILYGGIPENYAVVLTSPSCDERDLLVEKFLESGASKGDVTFYITIDPGKAKYLAETYQSSFYLFICNPRADKIIGDSPNVFRMKGVENLTEISIALTKAFGSLGSVSSRRRACLGIVSDVLLQHHAVKTRRWLTDLITELKARGFTTLAVMNPQMHPPEEVHAIVDLFEGEINIYEKTRDERSLRIKKMYNQEYLECDLLLKRDRLGR